MRLLLALALCLLVQPTMQHTGQIIWQPRAYEPAASTQASKSLAPLSLPPKAAPKVYGPAVEVSPSVGAAPRAVRRRPRGGKIYVAFVALHTPH
jgi:hypothetical protein